MSGFSTTHLRHEGAVPVEEARFARLLRPREGAHVREDPVQVAILYLLVVNVLAQVKGVKVKQLALLRLIHGLAAVHDREVEGARELRCIVEWRELRRRAFKWAVRLLRRAAEVYHRVAAHQHGGVGALVRVVA